MLKKIMIAAIASGALVVQAPGAYAVAVTADCAFNTLADETVTGGQDTYTGVAYGYAVSDTPGASISVTCEVRVNGGAAASTAPGPSGQTSVTADQVTYTASDTDVVTLCAVWTGSVSGEVCGATDSQIQVGLVGCTLVLLSRIGPRPFPGSPNDVVPYAVATALDVVDYVFCVVF